MKKIAPLRSPLALAVLALSLVAGRAQAGSPTPQSAWNKKFELVVDVEINQIDEPRYRRPFVAVWIEDAQGNTIRTLSVWTQMTQRGPRWIPNLKRWYRNATKAKPATPEELSKSYSSATRPAGKYSLVWDGLDDKGRPVKDGDYTVCIEAAREHGTYGLIRKSYKLGSAAFWDRLSGNTEIKGARVELRKK
ncbi:DUF2271 domain-containing protein [bacterium]|nr:MAG: DUF2271 domain-containing protein [bacterium]